MSEQDVYEHALAALHSAALDDAHWCKASGLIDEVCGTRGNMIAVGVGNSSEDVEFFFAECCYRGQRRPELQREYMDVFHAVDEHLPRLRRLPDGKLVLRASLFTEAQLRTSALYNDFMRRTDAQKSLTVRLDGPAGSRIIWATADPAGPEGWSSAQHERIAQFVPHVRQFVRMRHALVEARALGSSFAALLQNSRLGVVQLDIHGRIVAANDIARQVLRQGDGLCDPGGFLRARLPDDEAKLQGLLARALSPAGSQGVSGTMSVKRSEGLSPLLLHVNPVGDPAGDFRSWRAAALALIVDPRRRARIDPYLVETVLGLSPAESEVAVSLAEGMTGAQIAHATGRRESTVRRHLARISDKLGIPREPDVAQLVLSLHTIPAAPR